MNFHDLSLKLEVKAREIIGYTSRPYGKIFDVDSIECGRFAEVMILLLRIKNNFQSNDLVDRFIEKLKPFINESGSALNLSQSNELYYDFLQILSNL